MNKQNSDIPDSKYKTYISQVEKALKAFENTSEWADLIASLAKLNKVLAAHSRYSVIPKKTLIGKRLAQCMHPALPSGVHLKALETYDLIFKCIGTEELAVDIFTYCSGLFPLLGYAAINVRPILLQLYETYLLPLGTSLKAAMTGLIMGLLPGFESGSEFYNRTHQLLESFSDCVDKSYFYCCMWECICVSANVRHAGLNYILIHFDKKLSMEDQIYLIGTSLDLLVQALCLSLEDNSSLVQRCVLDLMISCFPIHNCQLPKGDIMKVLMCAVTVLLRRDMSLNRRLYAWLMGTDINGMPVVFPSTCFASTDDDTHKNQELSYFEMHSKEVLTNAIRKILKNNDEVSFKRTSLISLKIVISLLDRPEIISSILNDILLDILRCLYRECITQLNQNVKLIVKDKLCCNDTVSDESLCRMMKYEEKLATVEIYKTADILFGKFDPHFIWSFIADLFDSSCTSSESCLQNNISVKEFCDIVNFLLDKLSVETYIETQTEHFPRFLSQMIKTLGRKLDDLSDSDIVFTLGLCLKMFSRTVSCFGMFSEFCNYSTNLRATKGANKDDVDKDGTQLSRSAVDGDNEEPDVLKKINYETDSASLADSDVHKGGIGVHYQVSVRNSSAQSCISSFIKEYLTFFQQIAYKRIICSSSIEAPCMDYLFSFSNRDASWNNFQEIVLCHLEVNLNLTYKMEILDYICQLLIKCLFLPCYDASFNALEIPGWFQSLMVICVASSFNLQYIALSTLFNFLESLKSISDELFQGTGQKSNNTYSCYFNVLNDSTCFYKIVACSIWNWMSENGPQLSLKSVELFNRIHQNCIHSWVCEDVIAKEILSSDEDNRVNSSMQFMTFWDHLKDLEGSHSHHFEKSIMILLDSLDNNNYMFSSLSKLWVVSCVKSGDLVSILDPIVKVLLHPDTARVSVQHMDSEKLRRQSSFNDSFSSSYSHEAKIVAVSNEGGNIVYHVDNQNRYKSLKRLSVEEFRSLALTTLSGQGSSTKKASILLDNYPANSNVVESNVTLHVNPFGTSEEDNLNLIPSSRIPQNFALKAKRLDMKTCTAEEISFDEADFVPKSESLEVKSQIVSEILDEILHNVVYNSKNDKHGHECNKNFIEQETVKHTKASFIPSFVQSCGDLFSTHSLAPSSSVLGNSALITSMKVDCSVKKNVHSLRSYILLYIKRYDSTRVLYALRILKNVVATDPKLIINFLLSTNMSIHVDKLESGSVIDLFLRHKQSIMGHSFHSNLLFDVADSINGSTYLEVVVFVLLYFIRSSFGHNSYDVLNDDGVQKNKEVQISCCRLLQMFFSELAKFSQSNVKTVQHISNLLLKSKVQKTVLYSIYSSLLSPSLESSKQGTALSRMYQNALLDLTTSLIQLEDYIHSTKAEHNKECLPKEFEQINLLTDEILSLKTDVLFLSGHPIIYQPIFLEAIIFSLKASNDEQMHTLWINFIHVLMPYFSKASTKILTCVMLQLCSNMDKFEKSVVNKGIRELPPDYYIFLMKSLTTMYHHCLFESSCEYKAGQSAEIGKMLQSFSGQLMSGLANAFNFQGTNKGRKFGNQEELLSHSGTCSQILDLLPSISATLLNAWKFAEKLDGLTRNKSLQMNFTWSSRVKQCVLCFLSPIASNCMSSMLASFALIWNEKFSFHSYDAMVNATSSNDQLSIVDILREIKQINLNSLTLSIKQMLKQPGIFSAFLNKCKFLSLEGGLLQMVYAYIKKLPDNLIIESVTLFVSFLKDCYQSNLDSSAVFVLICILHFILQKGTMFEDKKEHKDIHDITHKLLESCSNIVGLSLEQAYFFRKYLAVKEDMTLDVESKSDFPVASGQISDISLLGVQQYKAVGTSTFSQSVQALHVLAEVTATLLDVVFQSDEKDKVTPLLNNILSSVFPYLRNHKLSNMMSFHASSKLIANLSSYQYTRRSWKKECFDLMLDSCFFQMDMKSLKCWMITIDNLMAHDKSTFLDLLARFSLAQSSSLNLFSSREAELEMKMQLLKRLSFTVFCSEIDQYQKHMPEIQEKLFDCLRSHNSPCLHAEVFSCFRVLALRMSSNCLTSLWPTMITELIQVLVAIEQSLLTEFDDNHRAYKTTDSLVNAGCDRNNDLFLAACKLLDLFLALPSENLPHFQLYKWAFVMDSYTAQPLESIVWTKESRLSFVPHATKISQQMHLKFGLIVPKSRVPNRLLIHSNKICALHELQEFFTTICNDSFQTNPLRSDCYKLHPTDKPLTQPHALPTNLPKDIGSYDTDTSPLELIESSVINDFLEKLS